MRMLPFSFYGIYLIGFIFIFNAVWLLFADANSGRLVSWSALLSCLDILMAFGLLYGVNFARWLIIISGCIKIALLIPLCFVLVFAPETVDRRTFLYEIVVSIYSFWVIYYLLSSRVRNQFRMGRD